MIRACVANKCREGRDPCDRPECVYLCNSWWARFLRWIGGLR